MAKIRSFSAVQAAIATLVASIQGDLQVALAEAREAETLTVGNVYPIQVGKIGAVEIVDATLLGIFTDEDGKSTFKFTYGDGADTEVVKCSAHRIKITDAEGKPVKTVAQVEAQIAAAHAKVAKLEEEAAIAKERENLVVGETYNIKVGRGDTRRVEAGVLVGIAETEVGTRFKFVFGEGFNTDVASISAEHIAWGDADEADDSEEVAAE